MRRLLAIVRACLVALVPSTMELLPAAELASVPSPLQITELTAARGQRVRDEDGDTPDWIEIQNRSGNSVDLAGWTLAESTHATKIWSFPATNLPAGGFLVVFASGKDRKAAGSPLHASFKLRAQGGSLVLHGPADEICRVDDYPPQVPGVSYGLPGLEGARQLSHRNGARDSAQPDPGLAAPVYAYLSKPTPARTNTPALCLGPRIVWLNQPPWTGLKGGEPLAVIAKVKAGADPVARVRLRFRVMFGEERELVMRDDGLHGDGAGGDSIYGAEIPTEKVKPGEMIRYCILAEDGAGQGSRWPLFENRRSYSAYVGVVRFDPSIQTRLPLIQIFSDTEQPTEQESGSGHFTLFYDGELYDNVALTIHGQISRNFPKPSFNLRFPRDHAFRWQTNEAREHGLTLLGNFADKSKIRTTLAYEMIAAAGSLGHLAQPVRLQMNGKFFAVAEAVEKGDERWLERLHRDPLGALYKMNNNLSGAAAAEKKTRQFEDARDLNSFARALSGQRSLAERAAYACDHVDLPQCISYLVALALISSDDHGHKNYYLYRDSRHSGEWALLPWDVDLSWGRNWTGQYFNETVFTDNPLDLYRDGRQKARNRLYDLLFQEPDFRQMYLRRLRTVMDEVLQPPGTPAGNLKIEKRVRELMDLIDPPGVERSDAALDQAAWPGWGRSRSMREESQRIIQQYLPGRRKFLFQSPNATLEGELIPPSQPADATIAFGAINMAATASEQFVCLTNQNAFAVDLTGWHLAGAIDHTFRPGTVIPAGKSIYVVANVAVFRERRLAPTTPAFVQGDWSGRLELPQGLITMSDSRGRTVASRSMP